jgi:hypothetical protein
MATRHDVDEEREPLTLEERYVGQFLTDEMYAIQEVENPYGWLVSDTLVVVEE